jgi:hypothetical protein
VNSRTDGEQRRDNFYSFAADKLEGARPVARRNAGHRRRQSGLRANSPNVDVPAYSIKNPTCTAPAPRASRAEPVPLPEGDTDRSLKVPLPSIPADARHGKRSHVPAYESKEPARDVVTILRGDPLCQAGGFHSARRASIN